MQQALSCVSLGIWIAGPPPRGTASQLALPTSADPLQLRCENGQTFHLSAGQLFETIQADGAWKVRTLSYAYRLSTRSNYGMRELIAWHWHHITRTAPHLHVGDEHTEFAWKHIPTGRVSFEEAVRFSISQLR